MNYQIECLNNIQKELEDNIELNQSLVLDRWPRKMEDLINGKKYAEAQFSIEDTVMFLNQVSFGGVSSGGLNFGSRRFYDELLETGNYQLIRNDSLRNEIAEHYTDIESDRSQIMVHSSRFSSYLSELRPFNPEDPDFISLYDQNEMVIAFRSNEFRRLVDKEFSYAYKALEYIQRQKKNSKRIIGLISSELNGQ